MKLNIKQILIMFLMVMGLGALHAQKQQTLEGNVIDENGNAIAGAMVKPNASKSIFTDQDGRFTLDVGSNTVTVDASGYAIATLSMEDLVANTTVTLSEEAIYSGKDDMVTVPFNSIARRRITGSVSNIDVQKELERDQRTGLNAILNGKVAGVFGATNTWGTGNALVVVDGIPRDYEYLDMMEVESVTVLKDNASKALYGAAANQGVILVTTRRGHSGERKIRLNGEYGVSTFMEESMPSYMSAADYMQSHSQSRLNDGLDVVYSQEQIDATRSGVDPTRYPDVDYFGDDFVNSSTNFTKVFGDIAGGNDDAQYYANFGYKHNDGWIAGVDNASDVLNMRGNVDFDVTNSLSMKVDAVANFEFNTLPNVYTVNGKGAVTENYWKKLRTNLPNAYPTTWDPNIITDPLLREEVMTNANLIDGMLMGGTNAYQDNLYGQMHRNGNRKEINRSMQFNTGIDWDMSWLTEGLRASAYGTMNFYNRSVQAQEATYAVYQPVYGVDAAGGDSISVWTNGENDVPGAQYMQKTKQGYFSRRFGFYGNINYDRTFGDHAISAVALLYRDGLKEAYDRSKSTHPEYAQDFVTLHYGAQANYAFQNKYILDVSAVMVGSQKLAQDDQWSMAPSMGAAWVLSEEEFLKNSSFVDFLKLRTSFGISCNDAWDDYYLYRNTYSQGGQFNYGNGVNQNQEINYKSIANSIGFQKRKDFTIGVDGLLLDKALRFEAGYFRSEAFDKITNMTSTYPNILGYSSYIYDNHNSSFDQGFEFGLEYNKQIGEVEFTIGSNGVYRANENIQMEEPLYADDAQHRYKAGRQVDGIWGWTADGLYGVNDFNADGSLVDGLPDPKFGTVQAGDIKYVDINEDGVIDADDQDIIGNNNSRIQYSLYVDLKYKNFEFYALGYGQLGQDRMARNDYFWAYGDMNYSNVLLDAYGPGNEDVNALYPRLSTTKNNNNYRNSTFWLYDNDWFTIPAMQLSYKFGDLGTSFLKDSKLYVRATDVVMINKNKDKSMVKIDAAPSTRSVAIGFVATF